jgi:hypothetical protein
MIMIAIILLIIELRRRKSDLVTKVTGYEAGGPGFYLGKDFFLAVGSIQTLQTN